MGMESSREMGSKICPFHISGVCGKGHRQSDDKFMMHYYIKPERTKKVPPNCLQAGL